MAGAAAPGAPADRRDGNRILRLYAQHADITACSSRPSTVPVMLIGTVEEIMAQVPAQRERYGFRYPTVLEASMKAFAPVMAELRGR